MHDCILKIGNTYNCCKCTVIKYDNYLIESSLLKIMYNFRILNYESEIKCIHHVLGYQ